MTNGKLLSVITYLMKETIRYSPIDELYDELDIFNIYVSGLSSSSLMENLDCLIDKDRIFYTICKEMIGLISEPDQEFINELHWELWEEMFEKHVEHTNKQIEKYIKTGEGETSVPYFFKNHSKYRMDYEEDLVEQYQKTHNKVFTSLEEVFNFCEEQEIDIYTNLYCQDDFLPTKYYILKCLYDISTNGIEEYVEEIREIKITELSS